MVSTTKGIARKGRLRKEVTNEGLKSNYQGAGGNDIEVASWSGRQGSVRQASLPMVTCGLGGNIKSS